MADDPAPPPVWKRDFPYESAAEDEVTRREFARYLVAGAGVMAPATSASPPGPSCAPSTPANHER
jgi:hypothetical protein